MTPRGMNNAERAAVKLLKSKGFSFHWENCSVEGPWLAATHPKLIASYSVTRCLEVALAHLELDPFSEDTSPKPPVQLKIFP